MKPDKKIIYYSVAFLIILACPVTRLFSQGTDIRYGAMPHLCIGLNISSLNTTIQNEEIVNISSLNTKSKNNLSGSIEIGYFISRYIGFTTGLGYSTYTSSFLLGSYQHSYDTVDSEQESYNRRITGENIQEIQKISAINIPFLFNIQLPAGQSFGFYLQTGANLAIPVSKTFSSTGVFSYTGYYPSYNVTFTNIPYEGFQSDVENKVKGELNIKKINTEMFNSVGCYLFVQNKLQFSLGMIYTASLSGISGYSPSNSFILSTYPQKVKSLMEGSRKVGINSVGIKFLVRIFIL